MILISCLVMSLLCKMSLASLHHVPSILDRLETQELTAYNVLLIQHGNGRSLASQGSNWFSEVPRRLVSPEGTEMFQKPNCARSYQYGYELVISTSV